MSIIRRFKRRNVDPITGHKKRKGLKGHEDKLQLIIMQAEYPQFVTTILDGKSCVEVSKFANRCKLFITKTIYHGKH